MLASICERSGSPEGFNLQRHDDADTMQRFFESERVRLLRGSPRSRWHCEGDPNLGPTEEDLSSWLKALQNCDSWALRYLLRENPSLLFIFPGSKGKFSNLGNELQCEGMSALNVAVTQGCEDLVQDISEVFEFWIRALAEERSPSSPTLSGKAMAVITPEAQAGRMHRINEELELFLLAEELGSGLNPLDLALWKGHVRIIRLLLLLSRQLPSHPYGRAILREIIEKRDDDQHNRTLQSIVSMITSEALGSTMMENVIMDEYFSDLGYRFQPFPVYFFHFCCAQGNKDRFETFVKNISTHALGEVMDFATILFCLLDAQGRTPLHLLPFHWISSLSNYESDFIHIPNFFVSIPDRAGRTILHSAVMDGNLRLVMEILRLAGRHPDVNKYWDFRTVSAVFEIDVMELRKRRSGADHGHKPSDQKTVVRYLATAAHMALLGSSVEILDLFVREKSVDWSLPCPCYVSVLDDRVRDHPFDILNAEFLLLTPLQMAAVWEDTPFLSFLIAKDRNGSIRKANDTSDEQLNVLIDAIYEEAELASEPRREWSASKFRVLWDLSALHLAAMVGNVAAIREMLNSQLFDPLAEDHQGNNALHYAAYGFGSRISVLPHWCDVPCPKSVAETRRSKAHANSDHRRQGCVNLLLQAGVDIWRMNKQGRVPEPGPRCSSEMLSWWNDKLIRETQETKQSLVAAAQAISVTGALVATASYIGPLQPPLGYTSGAEGEHVQTQSTQVQTFMVCDTFGFYVALSAIIFSLIPFVPLKQEPLMEELVSFRKTITLSLFLLILSILSITLAFTSAAIAVVENDAGKRLRLVIGPMVAGLMFCSWALYMMCVRFLRLIFHKNVWLRRHHRRLTIF